MKKLVLIVLLLLLLVNVTGQTGSSSSVNSCYPLKEQDCGFVDPDGEGSLSSLNCTWNKGE